LDGLLAFPYGFRGGAFVAGGHDLNGDGTDELVAGADAGGGPAVEIFRPNGVNVGGFYAFPQGFRGGVRVATGFMFGGPQVVTAAGPGGGPAVEVFRSWGQNIGGFYPYSHSFTGCVYVASGNVDGQAGD